MKVAFYAPLKPPDHPVPSGDRTMARALRQALRAAGYEFTLASRFRSYEGTGCAHRQRALRRRGEGLAARLLHRYAHLPRHERPDLWFSYHVYHKSPDWLGPQISAALDIPYVVAEASHAARQRSGPWAEGFRAAERAIAQAAALVCFNPVDVPGLRQLACAGRLHELLPFIDVERVQRLARVGAPLARSEPAVPRLISVAMMRHGDKLSSYRILAQALGRLLHRRWQLQIVGDGPARDHVLDAFSSFPDGRVSFLGAVAPASLPPLVKGAFLHLWPAVNEAWGMVFLEAAALGVASVGGDAGGVPAVVGHGRTGLLAPVGNAAAFADSVDALLLAPDRAQRMGVAARERAQRRHGVPCAAQGLCRVLEAVA